MVLANARYWPLQAYMLAFKGVTALLPMRWPQVISAPNALASLPAQLQSDGVSRVLLVTDATIVQLGLANDWLVSCQQQGIAVDVFADVCPDPTVSVIEAGTRAAQQHSAQAIVAIGGGSVIDAAKLIGACALNPVAVTKLVGLFKVRRGMLPLYAVPTTAGTGSEATIAAVVTEPLRARKLACIDLRLMPKVAVLDPQLSLNLPPAITAATGMDALTHAIEAYVSRNALARSDEKALQAARLIYTWLPKAYACDAHEQARVQMAHAAFLAGQAFTQAGVGYIHAIAHSLGARYHIPHGLANAIVMPHVLRFSMPACTTRMAQLARVMGLEQYAEGSSDTALAQALIERIDYLNQKFSIPSCVQQLELADIPAIVTAARNEARFTYAVPRYMSQVEGEALLKGMLPPQ